MELFVAYIVLYIGGFKINLGGISDEKESLFGNFIFNVDRVFIGLLFI